MKLYFSPFACSLATRISLYEAGADATFVEVDTRTQQTEEGTDFRTVHSLGLVPALEVEPGEVLTENAAILQFVAERFPEAELAPRDARGRTSLMQYLSFIGTELHKAVYLPLLDKSAPAEVKAYALAKAEPRLRWVEERVRGRQFLLEHFSVADAYLFAVLNWSQATPIDLKAWPTLRAYQAALLGRPSINRAVAEERELYHRELLRRREADARRTGGALEQGRPRTTAEAIDQFNDAFQRHDPALLVDLIADDCVLENTHPAPDGSRHVGKIACLAVWQSIAANDATRFHLESVDVMGERAIIHWRYFWGDASTSSVRGVNLMRVKDGLIVEGLGYVKGN